jgi:hypothetical protein
MGPTEKDQKESAAYVTALVQHHSFPVRFARAKNEALRCADGGYRAQRRQAHGKMFFVWAAIIGHRIRVESYHGNATRRAGTTTMITGRDSCVTGVHRRAGNQAAGRIFGVETTGEVDDIAKGEG